jgi:hypothetical protein
MPTEHPPGKETAGTTETDAPTMTLDDDSCGCTSELTCFQCYLAGDRGLPAVVPVTRSTSDVDWEAHP